MATKAKEQAPKSKSASERTAERRAELIAKGWKQKNYLLSPKALADLAAVKVRDGGDEVAIVERALAVLRDRNSEPSNAELAALVARRLKGST